MSTLKEELSDEELVKLCLEGNKGAFNKLVEQYYKRIYHYIVAQTKDIHVAEDLVQETFIKAYVDLANCRHPSRFANWLFSIARHRCQDWFRYRQRLLKLQRIPTTDLVSRPVGPDRLKILNDALEDLQDEYRQVIFLKHMSGMSCKEIAEQLGKPVGTITSWLSRAYQMLREYILKREM
jgi:RNA polymerase sigma-70 factor (ECF subfamily)